MPQANEVTKYPFWTFNTFVVLLLVVAVFCVVYLYIRRKSRSTKVDEKAGDEGQE